MLKENPGTKLAVLYQNDDFGKDYLIGLRDALGTEWDNYVVKIASYEVSDPTVDPPLTESRASGADTLLVAAVSKFAAQAIRKVSDMAWKPTFFMTNVSISVGSVLQPAGPEKAVGMISGLFCKDAIDPAWDSTPGCSSTGPLWLSTCHQSTSATGSMSGDTGPAICCGRCWSNAMAISHAKT
jgi:branched-chain amino acid transport system substrate-binding protein